jgi:hypothetical protein
MNLQERTSELIEIGRREVVLDDRRLEANRARILARAVALGVVGAGVAASTSAGAVTAASLAKWAVAAVVVSGSVGGTYALVSRSPEPQVPSQAAKITPSVAVTTGNAPRAVTEAPAAPSAMPEVALTEPTAPSAPAGGFSSGKARAPASSISEHADRLREARSALAAGEAARALALLDAHPEVGRGPLGPEWGAARILVLCRLGRVSEAKKLGQRFLKSHPSSPLAAQVAASCAAAK